MDQMNQMRGGENEKSWGGLIAVIIIVVLLILGGLYILNTRSPEVSNSLGNAEIADIDKEFSAAAINGLDEELNALDRELAL